MEKRVELACHTGFSRMNGIGLGEDWVSFAIENHIHTLVVTDEGNLDFYFDFKRAIKRVNEDIKLIMGVDLSLPEGRFTLLIKNETGKNNLYKILSEPGITLEFILDHKEGLLMGSGGKDGILKFDFLDYIEILGDELSEDAIRRLIKKSRSLNIPAVLVTAPRYTREDEKLAYCVLTGSEDTRDCHYRTTEELLLDFAFLGEDLAYEIIVKNSNLIADMCEEVPLLPDKKQYPKIKNQDKILRGICEKALKKKYHPVTDKVRERLEWELKAIESSESAFMFIELKELLEKLGVSQYEVMPRGSVGSSIVAYLCGITEVDPVAEGLCPYFFFGIDGQKEPDIDLNLSPDVHKNVLSTLQSVSGVGKVIKAGMLFNLRARQAAWMIINYEKEYKDTDIKFVRESLMKDLSKCITGKNYHPAGYLILPKDYEVTDCFFVERLDEYSDDFGAEVNGFDFSDVDNIIYKLDIAKNDTPGILKELHKSTGVDPETISTKDLGVMEIFKMGKIARCADIPEFGSDFVQDILKTCKCRRFDDLVKVQGFAHGTDVWHNNVQKLIKRGIVDISEVFADRNDVFDCLLKYGVDEKTAFLAAEDVRKGKVCMGRSKVWNECEKILAENEAPTWIPWFCRRVKYMFPKSHAYLYALASWRLAWYKLYYPVKFNEAMSNSYQYR